MNTHSPTLITHVALLCDSYQHWFKRPLLDENLHGMAAVTALANAPFAVVSHNTAPDPVFNYANLLALKLFEMKWQEFTSLPSRLSAESINQAERTRLLNQVSRHGYIENYSGVRIAKSGSRFMICNALIWNLISADGRYQGQAALIREWQALPAGD